MKTEYVIMVVLRGLRARGPTLKKGEQDFKFWEVLTLIGYPSQSDIPNLNPPKHIGFALRPLP